MSYQPKALRLADELETEFPHYQPVTDAAEELCRLYAANLELLKALRDLERTAGQASMSDDPVRVNARAVIAKAEGQQ